jgi:hypothetical protein
MMRYQDVVTTKPRGEIPSFLVPHQFDGVLAALPKAPALDASGTPADERF